MLELESATWTDVAAHVAAGGTLAVLPFGALEQHGPHLPLSTDTLQAVGVARLVAEQLDALLLPAVAFGNTWSNDGFAGTVSISSDTVAALCTDIARSVQGFGMTTLVVVNGDYGNRAPLQRAAESLAVEGAIPVLVLDYPGLVEIGDEVKVTAWAAPGLCHADELETSMILALAPELVHPERYVASYPELPADFGLRPMRLGVLSESGVFGDPRAATAEKGATIIAEVARRSVELVRRHRAVVDPR